MKQRTLYIIIGIFTILTATAQTRFRTSELKRLAGALSVDVRALPEGYSHPDAQGLHLTVHVEQQMVDHIGLHLFADEVRAQSSSPIFNFLERYFLQLKYPSMVKTTANMIRDDEFRFEKGAIAAIDDLRVTDDFSFSNDNHRYTAVWNRDGRTLLSVSFPVVYELISGENKVEAENNLVTDIRKTTIRKCKDEQECNDSYISKDFSNRLYFQQGQLVTDSRHPVESLANLMLSTNTGGSYDIRMTQISYGFQKKVFQVPLRQWVAFCQNNGCQLYFGVEDIASADEVSAVVLAVNGAENYNHVLTVSMSAKDLEAGSGIIEARLYPYVPTHNVLNMFAGYRKSNPKTFVAQ